MLESEKRIRQLDGLRGLAILFVLCFHFFNYGILSPFFYFGWSGVDLFFTLSGFLITGKLLDTKGQQGYYKNFIIKRILRIFPLYYGVLFAFSLVASYSVLTQWFYKYQIFFWTYTCNYLFLKHGFFQPLGHFWSLAIEEQFYLFWPLVVWLFTHRQLIAVSLFIIAIGIVIRLTSNEAYLTFGNPLAHMDGLLLGGISAILIRQRGTFLRYIHIIFALSVAAFSVYLWTYLVHFGIKENSEFYRLPLTFTLVSLIFSSFLLFSLQNEIVARFLSKRILCFFGKYSYGMYVFNSILFHLSNWAGVDRVDENMKLIFYAGIFIVTVLISYLSFNFYEQKFLNLKSKVLKRS